MQLKQWILVPGQWLEDMKLRIFVCLISMPPSRIYSIYKMATAGTDKFQLQLTYACSCSHCSIWSTTFLACHDSKQTLQGDWEFRFCWWWDNIGVPVLLPCTAGFEDSRNLLTKLFNHQTSTLHAYLETYKVSTSQKNSSAERVIICWTELGLCHSWICCKSHDMYTPTRHWGWHIFLSLLGKEAFKQLPSHKYADEVYCYVESQQSLVSCKMTACVWSYLLMAFYLSTKSFVTILTVIDVM